MTATTMRLALAAVLSLGLAASADFAAAQDAGKGKAGANARNKKIVDVDTKCPGCPPPYDPTSAGSQRTTKRSPQGAEVFDMHGRRKTARE